MFKKNTFVRISYLIVAFVFSFVNLGISPDAVYAKQRDNHKKSHLAPRISSPDTLEIEMPTKEEVKRTLTRLIEIAKEVFEKLEIPQQVDGEQIRFNIGNTFGYPLDTITQSDIERWASYVLEKGYLPEMAYPVFSVLFGSEISREDSYEFSNFVATKFKDVTLEAYLKGYNPYFIYLHFIMTALLDLYHHRKDPNSFNDEILFDFVRQILDQLDEEIIPIMKQIDSPYARVYDRAELFLLHPNLPIYPPGTLRLFEERAQALANYSPEVAAIYFALNGIHLRNAADEDFDMADLTNQKELLNAFFPILEEAIDSPSPDDQELARQYAEALLGGLLIPDFLSDSSKSINYILDPSQYETVRKVFKRFPELTPDKINLSYSGSDDVADAEVFRLVIERVPIWDFILGKGRGLIYLQKKDYRELDMIWNLFVELQEFVGLEDEYRIPNPFIEEEDESDQPPLEPGLDVFYEGSLYTILRKATTSQSGEILEGWELESPDGQQWARIFGDRINSIRVLSKTESNKSQKDFLLFKSA